MISVFRFTCGDYTVSATMGQTPTVDSAMLEHASLHDDFGVTGPEGTALVVTVERASEKWPHLVVSQRFDPGPQAGFHPGTLLIPENDLLLLGAGTRLLAYDLSAPRRLWQDAADTGFWGWKRHGDLVLMSAELELAAWDLRGKKLWTTFVEPPWDYTVRGDQLDLDVMGRRSSFAAMLGPDLQGAE